ncbi:HIT family protein [Promethearchaeum syntrophicum]|uniref:HIT family protein n=1 Tax=Promethearchaeum syntrophicum TaxID=2594042 RepID=A0A5B9D8G1_9ARCH|nr:HIT family protein [Candidatus Prometheoarchaeum syntrophicum]QEE14896.1 purine nucleoside phosphoramidase [Candidatus Prometheoarchaeum syntrophicum]
MSEEECIFCKIIEGQIPSYKIYENDSLLAFLDIFPLSYGHTVVVPKKHYYNFLDMPEDDMSDFFKDLRNISALIMKKLKIDGFNLVQNNFPAAGQVIHHLHFHIIPRMKGDGPLKMIPGKIQAKEDDLKKIIQKIKE